MTTEVVRFAMIGCCLLLVGFNIAIYRHMAMLVYAVRAWRLFVVGKTIVTLFVCWTLWAERHDLWSWWLPLVSTGLGITIVSLVLLEYELFRRREDKSAVLLEYELFKRRKEK